MNDLQIFNSEEFGTIRTIEDNSMIWFCGKDVASALGYTNPKKALNDHCKEKGVTIRSLPTNGGVQQVKLINEPNLYRLICHSKLPSAERFEAWVFEEVLPTVRKTGKYEVVQERRYRPTRPLTTDDYAEAAKTIAKCHNSRLPIVIDLYRKAGLDIEIIQQTQVQMQQVVEDDVDLVELLQQYTLNELCKLLNIARSSIFYYRTGRVKPHQKRKEFIIQTLTERR